MSSEKQYTIIRKMRPIRVIGGAFLITLGVMSLLVPELAFIRLTLFGTLIGIGATLIAEEPFNAAERIAQEKRQDEVKKEFDKLNKELRSSVDIKIRNSVALGDNSHLKGIDKMADLVFAVSLGVSDLYQKCKKSGNFEVLTERLRAMHGSEVAQAFVLGANISLLYLTGDLRKQGDKRAGEPLSADVLQTLVDELTAIGTTDAIIQSVRIFWEKWFSDPQSVQRNARLYFLALESYLTAESPEERARGERQLIEASKNYWETDFKQLVNVVKGRTNPIQSEAVQIMIGKLRKSGIRDLSVVLLFAAITEDPKLLNSALQAGADPSEKLDAIIERHREWLSENCPKELLEYDQA